MIFVILGTQKFQFNRLLEEIDNLISSGDIKDNVFAQIGYSTYEPKNYKYVNFLNSDEFKEMVEKCEFVITHAGTGAIISALQSDKKVIAVPRLARFGEHVDDHQLQISSAMKEKQHIEVVEEISELKDYVLKIENEKYKKFKSNNHNMIKLIRDYIDSI